MFWGTLVLLLCLQVAWALFILCDNYCVYWYLCLGFRCTWAVNFVCLLLFGFVVVNCFCCLGCFTFVGSLWYVCLLCYLFGFSGFINLGV